MILVLKGLSLECEEGRITTLLGANGAGKSTTLKAISGLLKSEEGEVTEGTIEFNGERINGKDPEEIVQLLRAHLDREGFEDVEITPLGFEPPARTDPDDPFLRLVVETAAEVYGRPQRIWPMSGGSGPNHAFIHELKVPVATAGVGYPGSNAHAPNENLVIDLFLKGVKHTTRILGRFAEAEIC